MALLGLLPLAAQAQNLPSEGPIDSDFTWTEKQQTMPTAGGRDAFSAESMLVITATNPASILDKLAGRCLTLGEQDPDGGNYSMVGTCTLSDADGDQIFEQIESTAGDGKAKLTGGTGKFEGITGEYRFTNVYYGSPSEDVSQGAGHKQGHYNFVR